MIDVQNITKTYGATVAVNDVSFRAEPGEIVGFLGPNGAGKSTALKILTCYIVADSGTVTVAGHDVLENSLEVRQNIGYLPENTPLYLDMRVQDYLDFIARVRGVTRANWKSRFDEVVRLTGIVPMLKKNIGHLSKGYRQRVGLAQALIHDPPILIFDEPTTGLDPHQIIEIRQLIRKLGEKKLVLFSSHIMQEISAICTRILVIKSGQLVANGSPEELIRETAGSSLFTVRIGGPREEVESKLGGLSGVSQVRATGSMNGSTEFQVQSEEGTDLGPQLFELGRDAGWVVSRIWESERSLEQLYLDLTEN